MVSAVLRTCSESVCVNKKKSVRLDVCDARMVQNVGFKINIKTT